MNLLQALAAFERRNLMLRVCWDVTVLAFQVQLVEPDDNTVFSCVHHVREEDLLPWWVEQLQVQDA